MTNRHGGGNTPNGGNVEPEHGARASEPRIADPTLQLKERNVSAQHQLARKWLAYSLIGLLFVEVLYACFAVIVARAFGIEITTTDITDTLALIFGPTVALVGSATGFYFGAKSKDSSE